MVEFGSFVGYTATRMGRAVELSYEQGQLGVRRLRVSHPGELAARWVFGKSAGSASFFGKKCWELQ